MSAYRFRRRAFLASVGGAFGLKILLRNLEASAAGGTSPPRFLFAHWPNGTVTTQFVPNGTGTSYVASPILQPFEDKGLRSDMISLFGFSQTGITTMGGAAEGGTVVATTGANSPGNRANGGEQDDAVAGGPSWDQILLKHVPALANRDASGTIVGPGSVNAICDARVDSYETSSRCLSYDYATRSVNSSVPGGLITEHTPRIPVLSPADLYASLFSGFMPGGNADAALRALRMRKSVLDATLRELARLNELAPASERVKIDAHTQAIRQLEQAISDRIADGGTGGCVVPEAPPPTMVGKTGDRVLEFGMPVATEADDETHEAVGKLHMSVIRAAFQCDLIRVATFQWAPGTGHVALRGLDPNSPDVIYRYRILSMRAVPSSFWMNPRPTTDAYVWDAIVNAHIWYSRRMADIVADFKGATDAFGGNLLDHTVIPYVTDMANPSFARSPLPALVFGGRALGMQGGQFQSVTGSHNNLWTTVAQAYLGSNPLAALADEVFVKTDVAPIPGLWAPPV